MGYAGTYDTSEATVAVAAFRENEIAFASATRVFKYNIDDDEIQLLAGTGVAGSTNGAGTVAQFNNIVDIAVDFSTGDLYVADAYSSPSYDKLRKIVENDDGTTTVTTIDTFTDANNQMVALCTSGYQNASPNSIYLIYGDATTPNGAKRLVRYKWVSSAWTKTLSTFTFSAVSNGVTDFYPNDVAVDSEERIYVLYGSTLDHGEVLNRSRVFKYAALNSATYEYIYLSDYNQVNYDPTFSARSITTDHQDNLYIAYSGYDYWVSGSSTYTYSNASFITKLDTSTYDEVIVAGDPSRTTKIEGAAVSTASFLSIQDIAIQKDGIYRTAPTAYPEANRLFIIDGSVGELQTPYLRQYYLDGASGG